MSDRPLVLFCISSQHFIPTGGIGSFCRGFVRIAHELGWRVVCVLDKAPSPAGHVMGGALKDVDLVWPEAPISDPTPENGLRFNGPADISAAMVENFKVAFLKALDLGVPDLVLVNTPEAIEAPLLARLPSATRIVFYTHHENLVAPRDRASTVFSNSYNDFLDRIGERPGVHVATQSQFNIKRMSRLKFSQPPIVLPMPIPDEELLIGYPTTRKGVLFIGRHEPRKNPKRFAEKVAKAGLPAKVLTNKRGEAKFRKTLSEAGVVDFEIRSELTGTEKAQFIRSARIAFHPALSESYGFSAMETLAAGLPTLCIEEYGWWQNFVQEGIYACPSRSATAKLGELYASTQTKRTADFVRKERETLRIWREFLNGPGTDKIGSIEYEDIPIEDLPALPDLFSTNAQLAESVDYSVARAFQNSAHYLPAISSTYVNVVGKATTEFPCGITGADLQFTNKKSKAFFYPWVLYSAGQGADTVTNAGKNNWLTTSRGKDGVVVVGDSGGFQIQEGTIKFDDRTPERMLGWLERVATYSMTLDFPTGGISRGTVAPHVERLKAGGIDIETEAATHGFSVDFMTCLLQTEANNAIFLSQRAPGKTKLLNVIQGRNERESAFWYKRVSATKFDGWAFAGKHHTQLSMTLRRLIEMHRDGQLEHVEWIHFLGISTLKAAFALTYIQRVLRDRGLAPNVQISFDSSSPTQASVNGLQAIVGFDLHPDKWQVKLQRVALDENLQDERRTICDVSWAWAKDRPHRHSVTTFVGNVVPIAKLVTVAGKKRPTLSPTQLALLTHHNTQAYIESFRRSYSYLEQRDFSVRPLALRHLERYIDAVFTPELGKTYDPGEALSRVDDIAVHLDALMLEQI